MGARYYAAWLGRWTSADPMGIGADGPGLYNYTRGSPINLIDPSGMKDEKPAETLHLGVITPEGSPQPEVEGESTPQGGVLPQSDVKPAIGKDAGYAFDELIDPEVDSWARERLALSDVDGYDIMLGGLSAYTTALGEAQVGRSAESYGEGDWWSAAIELRSGLDLISLPMIAGGPGSAGMKTTGRLAAWGDEAVTMLSPKGFPAGAERTWWTYWSKPYHPVEIVVEGVEFAPHLTKEARLLAEAHEGVHVARAANSPNLTYMGAFSTSPGSGFASVALEAEAYIATEGLKGLKGLLLPEGLKGGLSGVFGGVNPARRALIWQDVGWTLLLGIGVGAWAADY